MLAKSKLNSIETLILQASLDFEINHEEFKAIVNENEKYQKMNEDIRMIKCSNELNKEKDKLKLKQQNMNKNNGNARN